MGRKKIIKEVEKTNEEVKIIPEIKEVLNKNLEDVLEKIKVRRLSFAKVSWGTGKGPYIVAFEDEANAEYAEMNAHEFKSISINDLKNYKEVPIWECGAKTQEQIDALPKLNIEKAKATAIKEKEERKKARAEKMKATKAIKEKSIRAIK